MDKEAILKAELFSQYSEIFAGREVMFIKNFLAAMESYSTELRKENEELKRDRDSYRESFEINKEQLMELATHATDLKATIIKKDGEIAELKERVINLQQADMTHEYNNAEAARVWPQVEQQIREDEREKLQAQIAELKTDTQTMEEQDKLRCETYEKLIGQMEEQQRTISELKGLVSRMYNEFIRAAENTSPAVSENNWQQFKKQNNL